MSFKLTKAVKAKGGTPPKLRAPKPLKLPVFPRRGPYFEGSAVTIDELIAELKKARRIFGGGCRWHGWDDESLILDPRDVFAHGTISNKD